MLHPSLLVHAQVIKQKKLGREWSADKTRRLFVQLLYCGPESFGAARDKDIALWANGEFRKN